MKRLHTLFVSLVVIAIAVVPLVNAATKAKVKAKAAASGADPAPVLHYLGDGASAIARRSKKLSWQSPPMRPTDEPVGFLD